jgi:DnaJ-class molecular chaperone
MSDVIKKIKCFRCHGRGVVIFEKFNLFNFFTVTEESPCPACHGEGWIYD